MNQEEIVTNFINKVITLGYGDTSISKENVNILLKKFSYQPSDQLINVSEMPINFAANIWGYGNNRKKYDGIHLIKN